MNMGFVLFVSVSAVALGLLSATLAKKARRLGSRLDSLARPLHELRGALAALELGLSFVERSCGLRQQLNGCADSLHTSLDRAALAARDIDILRVGEPKAVDVKVEVEFQELVLRSARAWSFLAPTFASSLEIDWRAGPVRVLGHAGRLQQALDNLIANALEHGGPRVVIEGERRKHLVRVLISDGGGGLPSHLDGVLAQKPAATSPARGPRSVRGHGLSIANQVIREHQGRLALGMGSNGPSLLIELPATDGGGRAPGAGAVSQVHSGVDGRASKAA
jgi:signal transduction histidine kinase